MVSSSEKRRLLDAYSDPVNVRAAIAASAAGLLVVLSLGLIGLTYPVEVEPSAAVSSPRVASGR